MSSSSTQGYQATAWRAGKMSRTTLAVAGLWVACAGLAAAQSTAPKPAAPLVVMIDARQTAVVNATDTEHSFDLNIAGVRLEGQPTLWQIAGTDWQAADQVGQAPQVRITKTPVSGSAYRLSVAPINVDVFRFPWTRNLYPEGARERRARR